LIELSGFAVFAIVFGIVLIPRITFSVTWFFNPVAVASVLGGSAIVLSVLGVFFLPKVTMTYLLLEAVPGAPGSGEALYWIYLILAFLLEGSSKTATTRTTKSNNNTET